MTASAAASIGKQPRGITLRDDDPCCLAGGMRNQAPPAAFCGIEPTPDGGLVMLRGGLLWLIGIPLPVILILWLLGYL